MIPALVLTAGLATRLRPLSRLRAKAALPVAGEPLINRILTRLAAAGISDAVLNLHHLPHTITALVGDGTAAGIRVRYSWENPVLGSAGGPRRAVPLLASPRFLIVNGDTLTDVDIPSLVATHQRSRALVTLAVVPNTGSHKYGGVQVDAGGNVVGFCTKGDEAGSFHFVGVQVADAQAFASVPDDVPSESVAEVYPALIAERPGAVRGFVTEADFLDIGTPSDYLETTLRLARHEGRASVPTGERTRIAPGADVSDSVLWNDVTVDAGARLHRCIVTDAVAIPAHARWSNVTIRRASATLDANETCAGDLAIAPL